jgi:hypothetical protein
VTEDASADQRPEVLSALGTLAESAPEAVAPALNMIAYEALVLRMLARIQYDFRTSSGKNSAFDLVTPVTGQSDARVDALLMSPDGIGTAVEINGQTRSLTRDAFHLIGRRYAGLRGTDRRIKGLLIVTRIDQAPMTRIRSIVGVSSARQITVEGTGDIDKLANAITGLFEELRKAHNDAPVEKASEQPSD